MPRNDPTDTGGLFIGRRPGTGPLRLRTPAGEAPRRRIDTVLAAIVLLTEAVLCVSLWGPQPIAWLWVGSQLNYLTGSVVVGIVSAFVGMMFTMVLTLALLKRLDQMWKLVRRAQGHQQREGVLERIFVVSLIIGVVAGLVWLFVIQGPGSTLFPGNAP